jgi:hypothetical protein
MRWPALQGVTDWLACSKPLRLSVQHAKLGFSVNEERWVLIVAVLTSHNHKEAPVPEWSRLLASTVVLSMLTDVKCR